MNNNLDTMIMQSLASILIAIVGLLSVIAIQYINKLKVKAVAETRKLEDEATQKYVNGILDRVDKALSMAVDEVESTAVKAIKEVSSDNKLTTEDATKVRDIAKSLASSIVGKDLNELLKGVVGDTDSYVNSKIASLVIEKKKGLPAPTVKDCKKQKLNS